MRLEYKIGDCRDILKTLPDKSINCCVTSPPYFGLRDYGNDNQIGLEETPEDYVNEIVQVFREVRRVLRDDGTLWLNLGDSYNGSGKGQFSDGEHDPKKNKTNGMKHSSSKIHGLKPKDLIGIPWKVAFALQADGWYLRQDIIWHKPNPMPESVKDRCTKAHEYVFLFSKSQKYYFDNEAIQEKATTQEKRPDGIKRNRLYAYDSKSNTNPSAYRIKDHKNLENNGQNNHTMHKKRLFGEEYQSQYRNKRSVWTVNTKPFSGAHFATFPLALIEPCILAGCPEGGTVLDPFGGSGTTMECCRKNQRNCMLIELNRDYEPIIRKRAMLDIPDLETWC